MLMTELTFKTNMPSTAVVEEVQAMLSEKLTFAEQAEFNKWKISFVEEFDTDTEEICEYFQNYEEFYDFYVEPISEHFYSELDFSFLKNEVVEFLTSNQVIVILHYLNEQELSSNEHVVLKRLWEKYEKSKLYLQLAPLVDEKNSLLEILRLINLKQPVSVGNNDIVDLEKFTTVYWDGSFSNTGLNVYFNPENKKILLHSWSKWNNGSNHYRYITLEDYLDIIYNSPHVSRAVGGLKELISYL